MDKKAKLKKKKTINNLPIGIFNRLEFIIEFEEEDSIGFAMESILASYEPLVLGSCSTSCITPANPLDVAAFRKVINLPGREPYLQLPQLPKSLPAASKKRKIFIQPKYPSLIPLLMTAKFFGTDTRNYHVVTQRNSLRHMATADDNFVRFGSTLFLRRFSSYRTTNKNDVGFRFEEMCTTNSTSNVDFNQLIDGRIGNYRILMMGETDAIDRLSGASIELKCKKSNATKSDEHEWWLQAFLSKYMTLHMIERRRQRLKIEKCFFCIAGTKTIYHGRRTTAAGDDSIVTALKQYDTSTLSNRQKKIQTLNRLHSILNLLYSNVAAEGSYILRGCKSTILLYEVTSVGDKEKLTFITYELLQKFFVDE